MKNFQILLVVLFCALVSATGFGQTLKVSDHATAEPLFLVTVGSSSMNISGTTNLHGEVDISALKGADDIRISYVGYSTIKTTFRQLEEAGFSVKLKQSSINLGHITVSATRWRQSSADVPEKIVHISSEAVALQNPQTAADLLAVSGSVFVQKSQQGGGSPIIRGFSTNRLLYAVDGVRMNTAIFRSGNLQNVISLDPFAIENTEVLFGPGSVIYGSDAIGGVMSFQTLTPRFSSGDEPLITGNALARYATANSEKTGHFDVNIGFKKWSFLTSITATQYDHLKMGSNGPDDYLNPYYVVRQDSIDVVMDNPDPEVQRPSGFSQINMMQKIRFMPNENWDINYGFHYSETSAYGRYDRHQRMRNGLPRYAEWDYGPQIWMMNNLSITHSAKNALFDEATLRLAHQFFEESRISRNLNNPNRETFTEQVDALSTNLDFVKKTGSRNTLYYGVEGVFNDVRSTGEVKNISTSVTSEGPARYPQSTWASFGAYISDQFKVNEKLLLQGGLRYSYFDIQSEFDTTFYPLPFTTAQLSNGSLNGSIGLVYRPTEMWAISANASTGFRAPNVDDIGKVFDSEPGAVVIPNPDLQAEYAYNFDLGIARIFGEFLKIDLTGYYTLLNNALVRRDFQLNGSDSLMYGGEMSRVQAVQNAAVAEVYGIQAGIEVKLNDWLSLTSDFNYQYGTEEMDDGSVSRSRHAPPWFGVTRLTFSTDKLSLQVYSTYSGEVSASDLPVSEVGKTEIYAADSNGDPYAPGWYTLNFKARYNISNQLAVSCGLENITDQRYRPYSSGISAAGRNFILSLSANF